MLDGTRKCMVFGGSVVGGSTFIRSFYFFLAFVRLFNTFVMFAQLYD